MDFITSVFAFLLSIILSISPSFPYVPHKSDFVLTWSDEFDGEGLDYTKWGGHCFDEGTAMRKGGFWNLDFAQVKNGNLHIKTEFCPEGYNGNNQPGWYTCGIDTSRSFEQKYGYFEVRCILPKGVGQWSAFWLMCDGVGTVGNEGTDGTEIDIFESAFYAADSFERNRVTCNLHYDGYSEEHRSVNVCAPYIFLNNPYEEFNTYGLEWNEEEYIFYINGIKVGKSSFGGVSKTPEWPILSVEIGGEAGVAGESWVGASVETNIEPLTDFIVDYVRVYQYSDLV